MCFQSPSNFARIGSVVLKGLCTGFLACPCALLTLELQWSLHSASPAGHSDPSGAFVSKVVVDCSANESIRKLLAAEILSQRRVVHSLRKLSEGLMRINLCWLWPS